MALDSILADPLPGDPVGPCRSRRGSWAGRRFSPKPHGHHAGLAFGQGAEHRVQLPRAAGWELAASAGWMALGVLDEVAELAVAVLAEREVQRRSARRACFCTSVSFSGVVSQAAGPARLARGWGSAAQVPAGSCRCTRASVLVASAMCTGRRMVAGLLGHRPGDRLPDPPGGVGWRTCSPGCSRNFSTPRIRPRLPSWIRSRISIPRPAYRRATETTRRRLASSRWSLALLPSSATPLKIDALAGPQHPARPPASLSSANRPASIRLGQLDLLPGGGAAAPWPICPR